MYKSVGGKSDEENNFRTIFAKSDANSGAWRKDLYNPVVIIYLLLTKKQF
jgi:hypothetical protein